MKLLLLGAAFSCGLSWGGGAVALAYAHALVRALGPLGVLA